MCSDDDITLIYSGSLNSNPFSGHSSTGNWRVFLSLNLLYLFLKEIGIKNYNYVGQTYSICIVSDYRKNEKGLSQDWKDRKPAY